MVRVTPPSHAVVTICNIRLSLPGVTASHVKGAGRVPGAPLPGEGAMPGITPQSTLGLEDIAAAGEGRRAGVLSYRA